MSGDSTHGVGAALCAWAEFASAVIAVAASSVLIDRVLIRQPPNIPLISLTWIATDLFRPNAIACSLNKSRTSLVRQYRQKSVVTLSFPASCLTSILEIQSRACPGEVDRVRQGE